MSTIVNSDAALRAQVLNLVLRERALALSMREWQHRLAGYGYGIRETKGGQIIESLPHGVEICAMPTDMSA